MESLNTRETILNRIKQALRHPVSPPAPALPGDVFYREKNPEAVPAVFRDAFSAVEGRLWYCENKAQLYQELTGLCRERAWTRIRCSVPGLAGLPAAWQAQQEWDEGTVSEVEVAVTDCECLVARTGSFVMSSAQLSGRVMPVYAPVHIVVASADQIVYDTDEALLMICRKYGNTLPSGLFFVSGPSRTGDIEKTLVMGVHGPVEIHLFLLPESGSLSPLTDQDNGFEIK